MYHESENSHHKGDNRSPDEKVKNPYEVLGLNPGASQADIKKAYRRLALKYHPDKVQGEEAKKHATATFAEVSAAYEILTNNIDHNENDGEASPHQSFTGWNRNPMADVHPRFDRASIDPFHPNFNHYGFSEFGSFQFSDPFELFRRIFEGESMDQFQSPGISIFPSARMREDLNEFPSEVYRPIFDLRNNNFSTSAQESHVSSSQPSLKNCTVSSFIRTYHQSGNGHGCSNSSKIISTTTKYVNGNLVSVRKETVINPDGTQTTNIYRTGDDGALQNLILNPKTKRIYQSVQSKLVNGESTENRESEKNGSDGKCLHQQEQRKYTTNLNTNIKGSKWCESTKLPSGEVLGDNGVLANQPFYDIIDDDLPVFDQTDLNKARNMAKKSIAKSNYDSSLHGRYPNNASMSRKRKFVELFTCCFSCCFLKKKK